MWALITLVLNKGPGLPFQSNRTPFVWLCTVTLRDQSKKPHDYSNSRFSTCLCENCFLNLVFHYQILFKTIGNLSSFSLPNRTPNRIRRFVLFYICGATRIFSWKEGSHKMNRFLIYNGEPSTKICFMGEDKNAFKCILQYWHCTTD